MNINDLIQNQKVTISVTSEQLTEFAYQILDGAKVIYEKKDEPEQYITRKQAAQMLDIDQSSLWRWSRQGYLIPIEVGGKRRYRMSDINKILRKGATA